MIFLRTKLCDTIIYNSMQGISEPSLRYIACRVAQELCTVLGDKAMSFKKPLFMRYYYSRRKIKI